MIYLINRVVAFNPDNGSLKNVLNHREVFLSSLNAQILHQLLKAGPVCLRREELLQQVWQQHGLSPASATLSQYISVTRRALVSIGLQERLIITVAKTGYRLNNSIHIETENTPCSPGVVATELNSHSANPLSTHTKKKPLAPSFLYINLVILLLATAGLLCFLINKRYQELYKPQGVIYIGKINSCPIYFLNTIRDEDQQRYLKFLATNNLVAEGCIKDEVILAQASRQLNMSEGIGHQFVAKCSIDMQGNYYYCENEYTTLWQSN
ncbi:winged helix-turn-helix domain-containing protein [Serratia sp. 2723]|uniref:winged helix-turn-helix domain-containing protein n=1 Tax=unclassified Serratia (in: enterobacteria) TaxID=2647522 RepID=UPI003D1CB11A